MVRRPFTSFLVLLVLSASAYGEDFFYDTATKTSTNVTIYVHNQSTVDRGRIIYNTVSGNAKYERPISQGWQLVEPFPSWPIDWSGAPAGVQTVFEYLAGVANGATDAPIEQWLSTGGDWTQFDPNAGGGPTNNAPTIAITAPTTGTTYASDADVTLTGVASDTEDGDISTSIVWTSSLDGVLGTFSSATLLNTPSIGTHTITAQVTDSQGAVALDQITIEVTSDTGGGVDPGTPPDGLSCFEAFVLDANETGAAAFLNTIGGVMTGTEHQSFQIEIPVPGQTTNYSFTWSTDPTSHGEYGGPIGAAAAGVRALLSIWFGWIFISSVLKALRQW